MRQEQHTCFRTVENMSRSSERRRRGALRFSSFPAISIHRQRMEIQRTARNRRSRLREFARKGVLNLDGLADSGADWLERLRPYIQDGKTIMVAPHRVCGPETNDLVLQLRKRRIGKIILGGMLANMCAESHLRELIEHGFEVAVAKDVTAAPKHPKWELRLHCRADQLCVSRACGLDDRTKPSRRWSAVHKARTNP
jgi:hypothetical protein